jgi:hypothetical protein
MMCRSSIRFRSTRERHLERVDGDGLRDPPTHRPAFVALALGSSERALWRDWQ